VDCNRLVRDRVQWRPLMNSVTKLSVSIEAEEFLDQLSD
jgi:hypothetical protein